MKTKCAIIKRRLNYSVTLGTYDDVPTALIHLESICTFEKRATGFRMVENDAYQYSFFEESEIGDLEFVYTILIVSMEDM